ncbi:hypothetical protein [Streptomyces minutiscleroticus]|uniref:hypothetical protein n=1 Tax=Streptomyces minutiscleroticus TaxID=68238 RepID=UPI00167E4372|nr:hypothetical protein [Streptomyces minutiscleroticus]
MVPSRQQRRCIARNGALHASGREYGCSAGTVTAIGAPGEQSIAQCLDGIERVLPAFVRNQGVDPATPS